MKIYLNNMKQGWYVGLDLATKSGFAIIHVTEKKTDLVNYTSINIPTGVGELEKLGYIEEGLLQFLDEYLPKGETSVTFIIEDCFLGKWNPKTFKLLARLEGFIINTLLHKYNYSKILLIYPAQSRKLVGLAGNVKKEMAVDFVNTIILKKKLLGNIHHNIADAIILACAGGII